jgi:ribosomal protein S18 acetylase RimI-like enzyme
MHRPLFVYMLAKVRHLFVRPKSSAQLAMFRPVSSSGHFNDALPPGYEYASSLTAQFRLGWIRLLADSREFVKVGNWDEELLQDLILKTLIPGGVVLVLDSAGEVVACLSVCSGKPQKAELMYVLVDPNHRRRGVARAMMRRGLNVCSANAMASIRLVTDQYRLGAIKLYFQHGFIPDLNQTRDAEVRWSWILEKAFSTEPDVIAFPQLGQSRLRAKRNS